MCSSQSFQHDTVEQKLYEANGRVPDIVKAGLVAWLLITFGGLPSFALGNDAAVYPENPFVTAEALYVSGTGISRYDIETLVSTWDALQEVETFEPIVVDDSVLVGSTKGLYAVDKVSGVVKWHIDSAAPVFSPVVFVGRAYAGSQDGIVRAIDLTDGSIVWERSLVGWIYPPVVHHGVLIVGGRERTLYGLSTKNGAELWTKPLPQELVYRPVSAPPGLALLTTFSGDLIAVDTTNGETVWQTRDPAAGFPPLVHAGRIYMGAFDGKLRSRDISNGVLVWEYPFGDILPYTPRITNDNVLIGSEHGRIAAVDRKTGKLLWHREVNRTFVDNPVLVNRNIVVPMAERTLFVLDQSTVAPHK